MKDALKPLFKKVRGSFRIGGGCLGLGGSSAMRMRLDRTTAFDTSGRSGHRLITTAKSHSRTWARWMCEPFVGVRFWVDQSHCSPFESRCAAGCPLPCRRVETYCEPGSRHVRFWEARETLRTAGRGRLATPLLSFDRSAAGRLQEALPSYLTFGCNCQPVARVVIYAKLDGHQASRCGLVVYKRHRRIGVSTASADGHIKAAG
jgi:hypothetical protein